MNKSIISISAVLILTLGAGGFLLLSKDDSSKTNTSGNQQSGQQQTASSPSTQVEIAQQVEDSAPKPNGSYANYSEDAVAKADGDTYLFFHAPWCSQCRSIEAGIVADGVPDGVTILKVDYDSGRELRKKYGVTIQTTFIKVDKSGEKKGLYVAYSEPTFTAVIRDFIN
jgi:thiol-disulfide isomerase/thioredoxin